MASAALAAAAVSDHASDFTRAIDSLLSKTDSLIEVRHTTSVETSVLKQLVGILARKIELQEINAAETKRTVHDMGIEISRLRADNEAARATLVEVRHVSREVEAVKGEFKRMQLSMEHLKQEHDALHLDVSHLVAQPIKSVGASSRGASATPLYHVDPYAPSSDARPGSDATRSAAPSVQLTNMRARDAIPAYLRRAVGSNDANYDARAYDDADEVPTDVELGEYWEANDEVDEQQTRGSSSTPQPVAEPAAATTPRPAAESPALRGGNSALKRAQGGGHPAGPRVVKFGEDDSDGFAAPPPPSRAGAIGAPPPKQAPNLPDAANRSLNRSLTSQRDSLNTSKGSQRVPEYRPLAGVDLADTMTGPRIIALKPGGPGEFAGLNIGDTVIRFNGKDIKSKADFVAALNKCVPGQCVDVAHRHEGHAIVISKMFLGSAERK